MLPGYFLCGWNKCNICVAFLKFVIIFVSFSKRYIAAIRKDFTNRRKVLWNGYNMYFIIYSGIYILYIDTDWLNRCSQLANV